MGRKNVSLYMRCYSYDYHRRSYGTNNYKIMKNLLYFILGLITGLVLFVLLVKYSPDTVRYTFFNLVDIEVETTYE